MNDFEPFILSSLSILRFVFGRVSSIGGNHYFWQSWPYLASHVTWKRKTPKTKAACIFLWWNKCQRVKCIQMQKLTYGFVEIYVIEKALTSQNLYDVVTFNQITTNPHVSSCIWMQSTLWLCPTEKRCLLSFRSFCFQGTWLTKYGHEYGKSWQPPIEGTWSKTNRRILRKWVYSFTISNLCWKLNQVQ